MILSAGLSPAWQQTLSFDRFLLGEVNRASRATWSASGKVINVALALRQWETPVRVITPVGGPGRESIEADLDRWGIEGTLVPTEAGTRVCTTLLDRATKTMTELVENARPMTADELDRFRQAYAHEAARAEVVVLIGSLPEGVPATYYGELLDRTPCPTVLDYRGPGLLDSLARRPFLVKPNRDELAQTVGRSLDDDRELVAAMRELNRLGAEWVLVTDGGKPAWLGSAEKVFRLVPPKVDRPVSPLGSGDTLAGTIAWAKTQGMETPESVRLGLAAATDNLRYPLPARFDPDRARDLAQQIVLEEVCPIGESL